MMTLSVTKSKRSFFFFGLDKKQQSIYPQIYINERPSSRTTCIAKVENSTYTMQCMHHALRMLIGLRDEPASGALSAKRVERESVSTAPNFAIESSSRVTSIFCMYDCLIKAEKIHCEMEKPVYYHGWETSMSILAISGCHLLDPITGEPITTSFT
jgi:hypothetical protein